MRRVSVLCVREKLKLGCRVKVGTRERVGVRKKG